MPTWLNENSIEGEMSDDDFIKRVQELMTKRVETEEKEGRPGDYGNDGMVPIYGEKGSHAGVRYKLIALRYFAVERLPDGQFRIRERPGMNNIGKYVIVERRGIAISDGLKDLLDLSEFLWHDSLHSGMEDWTLQRQWEKMEERAHNDCKRVDSLLSQFDKSTKTLRAELQEFIRAIKTD